MTFYFVALASGSMIKKKSKILYACTFINAIGITSIRKSFKIKVSGIQIPCFFLLVRGLEFKLSIGNRINLHNGIYYYFYLLMSLRKGRQHENKGILQQKYTSGVLKSSF